MFYTIEELVQQADRDYQGNIAELMIATETELSGRCLLYTSKPVPVYSGYKSISLFINER